MLTTEQVLAAQKANVETLFGLTNKAFEGVEKLVELNLQVAKASLGETAEGVKAALSVKDAQELMALQAGLLQPAAEKAAAYSRHLYDIAASTNADITKIVEAQTADVQAKYMAVVDAAAKNAPAGSENAVALVRSAVAAANNAFETVQKAGAAAAASTCGGRPRASRSFSTRTRARRSACCGRARGRACATWSASIWRAAAGATTCWPSGWRR